MDDEEAKRIQEERDKQLTEEYKELQNPKKPDYNKIINEAGFQPDWDEIDPPMKGQGLVNEALMLGASAGIAAAAKPLLKTIGPAGAIDAGINIATGESDTAFEKKLELIRPIKVAHKATRLMLDKIFDQRVSPEDLPPLNLAESHKRHPQITKLSDLKKQATNRRILDETSIDDGYVEEIIEHGDDVIYPPGSKEADILANTKAMASDAYETDLTKFYAGENVPFPVRVLDDVPQDIRSTMAWESGMKDGVFDFERWLSRSLYGKRFRSRTTVSKMQAPFGADVNFESYRDNILLPQFEKEWGPILDKLKIPRSSLQAHHIFAIRASAGLYDGLQFGSKEWVDVTNTLLSKYIRPGDVPKNLMPLVGSTSDVGTPHYITHRYIDEIIGPTGETFFTKEVRKEMKRNHKFRIKKTLEFAEQMKTAEGVAVQAQKVWDRIYGPGQVIPEELVEELSALPMQVNPKYRTDVKLEELVRQVFSQIEEFPFPESMSRKEFIKNWLPQFEGKGFDALRRMFEVDQDLTPEEAMQTPLGYRLQKYLQDRVIRNPIKKKYIKRKKK